MIEEDILYESLKQIKDVVDYMIRLSLNMKQSLILL